MMFDESARHRFADSYAVAANGCWEWTRALSKKGYGCFNFKGWPYRANRVAYETFVGPIPRGLFVLHSCDNPKCVNPDHLRVGTHDDNMADKVRRNRQFLPKGERHGMAKLCAEQVREIRASKDGPTQLAKHYGVTPATICDIRKRRSWAHL